MPGSVEICPSTGGREPLALLEVDMVVLNELKNQQEVRRSIRRRRSERKQEGS